jgi:YHS domain-containing protein
MIRFLASLLLIYFIYRLVTKKPPREIKKTDSSPQALVQAPQCQGDFPRENAHRLKVGGETHYFCSRECLKAFQSGKKDQG